MSKFVRMVLCYLYSQDWKLMMDSLVSHADETKEGQGTYVLVLVMVAPL